MNRIEIRNTQFVCDREKNRVLDGGLELASEIFVSGNTFEGACQSLPEPKP